MIILCCRLDTLLIFHIVLTCEKKGHQDHALGVINFTSVSPFNFHIKISTLDLKHMIFAGLQFNHF